MKDRRTYLLLAIFGGMFGVHKFYLLKPGQGLLYMCTAGLFCIGWAKDVFTAYQAVDQYNAKRGFVNTTSRDSIGA